MGAPPPKAITRVLNAATRGDAEAGDQLLTLVYDELRRLADRLLAREAGGQTLQPTALVHEAWLRLVGEEDPSWEGRRPFFHAAARAMRRILIERARRKGRLKHGGAAAREPLSDSVGAVDPEAMDLVALDACLARLQRQHGRIGKTVELRFFAGLSVEETARVLDVSPATVKRDWSFAKAWLHAELRAG